MAQRVWEPTPHADLLCARASRLFTAARVDELAELVAQNRLVFEDVANDSLDGDKILIRIVSQILSSARSTSLHTFNYDTVRDAIIILKKLVYSYENFSTPCAFAIIANYIKALAYFTGDKSRCTRMALTLIDKIVGGAEKCARASTPGLHAVIQFAASTAVWSDESGTIFKQLIAAQQVEARWGRFAGALWHVHRAAMRCWADVPRFASKTRELLARGPSVARDYVALSECVGRVGGALARRSADGLPKTALKKLFQAYVVQPPPSALAVGDADETDEAAWERYRTAALARVSYEMGTAAAIALAACDLRAPLAPALLFLGCTRAVTSAHNPNAAVCAAACQAVLRPRTLALPVKDTPLGALRTAAALAAPRDDEVWGDTFDHDEQPLHPTALLQVLALLQFAACDAALAADVTHFRAYALLRGRRPDLALQAALTLDTPLAVFYAGAAHARLGEPWYAAKCFELARRLDAGETFAAGRGLSARLKAFALLGECRAWLVLGRVQRSAAALAGLSVVSPALFRRTAAPLLRLYRLVASLAPCRAE